VFLVTGAQGQLGSELKEILTPDQALFVTHSQLDIRDEKSVRDIVSKIKFDFIINCAAYTAVDKAEDEPEEAYAVNVTGAKNLAETGVPLVQISTDYVFDGNKSSPYVETDMTNPLSTYGKTKLESERVVLENSETAVVIRTSWLHSKYGNNFVKTLLKLASERDEIRVVSNQIGTPTAAADLANAILHIIPQIPRGFREIYHFSNDEVCSWYDFAVSIVKNAGLKCRIIPIKSDDYPQKAKRPSYSVLSKDKIRDAFGVRTSHRTGGSPLRNH
jgi:dTDP-4-dehydrorhamnose reductase